MGKIEVGLRISDDENDGYITNLRDMNTLGVIKEILKELVPCVQAIHKNTPIPLLIKQFELLAKGEEEEGEGGDVNHEILPLEQRLRYVNILYTVIQSEIKKKRKPKRVDKNQ